jgi:hypothetical protein
MLKITTATRLLYDSVFSMVPFMSLETIQDEGS